MRPRGLPADQLLGSGAAHPRGVRPHQEGAISLGIIGFGRLGGLLARYFSSDFETKVYDPKLDARRARKLGATPASFAEACAQEVVVPSVPISAFEGVVRRMGPRLKPGALVVDVCSVKEHPVRAMRRWLPRGVDILATHPNFGPDSAAESLEGRTLILHPVRIGRERYSRVRKALQAKGLALVEMTPREHDRRMASSLVLTHFIGRSLIRYGSRPTGVDTEGYRRLLRILQTVQNDSWELFEDMNRYNAYAAPMRRKLLAAMSAVDRRVR